MLISASAPAVIVQASENHEKNALNIDIIVIKIAEILNSDLLQNVLKLKI
jgi:hypothetical protein